jgi:hypothetical protein
MRSLNDCKEVQRGILRAFYRLAGRVADFHHRIDDQGDIVLALGHRQVIARPTTHCTDRTATTRLIGIEPMLEDHRSASRATGRDSLTGSRTIRGEGRRRHVRATGHDHLIGLGTDRG